MLMRPYTINHDRKIVVIRDLYLANQYCEKHGLPYPQRIYEQDIQPHAKNWFGTKGDALTNRAEKEKERMQPPQLSKAARA